MQINYFAVVAAAVSAFLIGGLWYSPLLFERPWRAANGFADADLKKQNPAVTLGGSFVLCLLMALNLAAFLGGPETTATWGATAGALAGVGWVAFGISVVALFEGRPVSYMLINGGYWGVALAVMGLILGAWR